MTQGSLSSLRYTISEDLCPAEYREDLQVTIREALGQALTVAPGKRYVVRGDYVSDTRSIGRLCLSSHGRSQGKPAEIRQGRGQFEVTADVLNVTPGKEDILDLILFDQQGKELGVRMRLNLKTNG